MSRQGGLRTRPYPEPTIRHSRFAVFPSRYSPSFATRYSRLAVFFHSRFAIRHSPSFAARHSLLAARRLSPFAIRHSQFAIRRVFPLLAVFHCG
jgi:hypothetical protein